MTGTTFGKFHTLDLMSRDEATETYRAIDGESQQVVMLKRFHKLSNVEGFEPRFKEVMNRVIALDHPHILPTLQVEIEQDIPYIVMAYPNRGTLQDLLAKSQETGLPISEIVSTLSDIAIALDYAHQQGFVHQDLQPANIFITQTGNPCIAGFGIVDILLEFSGMTLSDRFFGSPPYFSPEQISGQALDGRCDIYALGIIGYEMVSGKRPFEGDMVRVFMQHMNEPPPQLTTPSGIDAVILKALQKAPSDRYATAKEMSNALLTDVVVAPIWIKVSDVKRALQRQKEVATPTSDNQTNTTILRVVAGSVIVIALILAIIFITRTML